MLEGYEEGKKRQVLDVQTSEGGEKKCAMFSTTEDCFTVEMLKGSSNADEELTGSHWAWGTAARIATARRGHGRKIVGESRSFEAEAQGLLSPLGVAWRSIA